MNNKEYLIQQFNKYGMNVTDVQTEQLIKYYQMIYDTNKVMNLTAIDEYEQVVIKHFVDSVLPINLFSHNATVVDIGAGAGFPSIPLKILRSDLDIVMLDSLGKRVDFLNNVIRGIGLTGIRAEHVRAEDYAKVSRETFDYAIARAVASMPTLVEYCLPLVKVGGDMIAYKANVDDELQQAQYAVTLLGGKVTKLQQYNLEGDKRTIVVINKVKNTPTKYPRGQNKPRISPLIIK